MAEVLDRLLGTYYVCGASARYWVPLEGPQEGTKHKAESRLWNLMDKFRTLGPFLAQYNLILLALHHVICKHSMEIRDRGC